MDLGKIKFSLGITNTLDTDTDLQNIFRSLGLLQREIDLLAGVAYIEASAAVAVGNAVNITTGKVKKADAATNLPAIGICVSAAAIGQKAGIIIGMGFARGLTGLTVNASVYLGNAGALVFARPGAGFIQGLGYALSATEMFVTIAQP
jgi:hypothetical protein